MSLHEFVFGFITIITGLGLAQIATSFVSCIAYWERVLFSPMHAVYMFVAFATTVTNWISFWPPKPAEFWSGPTVLLYIVWAFSQFVFCGLASPTVGPEGIDLAEWHVRTRKRYLAAAVGTALIAIGINFLQRALDPQWQVWAAICVLYSVLAILTAVRWRWVRLVSAIALVLFCVGMTALSLSTFGGIAN